MLVRGTPKTPFSLKNFIAGMTHPTPGAPCIPRRWRPQPQHTRGGLHRTGSSAGRARCKADHARSRPRTGTHARTLDTLHRSALDARQTARGDLDSGGRWRTWSVSETEQKRTAQNLKNKYAKKRKCLLTFTQESV